MTATELKEFMKSNGVYQWQVADFLGVSEATFTRIMRHPSEIQANQIEKAVEYIVANSTPGKTKCVPQTVIEK